MDMPAGVVKKPKAEEVTDTSGEKFGLNSRSAAACREVLNNSQPNATGKELD
jgi:hypothetical protein